MIIWNKLSSTRILTTKFLINFVLQELMLTRLKLEEYIIYSSGEIYILYIYFRASEIISQESGLKFKLFSDILSDLISLSVSTVR